MAAELDLDPPLPEEEWVHGEEAPTDGTNEYGDTDFVVTEPITYTVAEVIEEMIDAVQVRRDYIQLPRYSFAFGIGTGSAAGALAGLADNQEETFPEGFVARPVIGHAESSSMYYLARYLKSGGTYEPEDEEEMSAVFRVWITGQGDYRAWRWSKVGGEFGGPYNIGPPERELSDGVTAETRQRAGPVYIGDLAFQEGDGWAIKAYRKQRRTDHAIAYVLVSQLIEALEETQLGNNDASIDFGEGAVRAKIFWTSPEYEDYEGKFVIYDTDPERISGFEGTPFDSGTPWSHDGLKKGMDGAIMQCRGMLNDLRWATAVEIPPVSDDVEIDNRVIITATEPPHDASERIGTDVQAPWLRWPPKGRVALSPAEYTSGIMQPGAAVGLAVVPFAANEYEYEARFYDSSTVRILRLQHSDEAEPKVVRLRFRKYPFAPHDGQWFPPHSTVCRLRDAAGSNRATVALGVYADTPNGDLRRLFAEGPDVLEDPAQTSYDDFRAGDPLANVDGEEIILFLPKKEVGGPNVEAYIAMVGEATVLEDTWDGWVPVTDIPPLVVGSYNNVEATTGRGYDTVFLADLEVI